MDGYWSKLNEEENVRPNEEETRECHRTLCDLKASTSVNVWIILVGHKIASMDTCERHCELVNIMTKNLFKALADFWIEYKRCLEDSWEVKWSKHEDLENLENMFKSAVGALKIVSFLRNEMKPELIMKKKYSMFEETYETIAANTEDIKQEIFKRSRNNGRGTL